MCIYNEFTVQLQNLNYKISSRISPAVVQTHLGLDCSCEWHGVEVDHKLLKFHKLPAYISRQNSPAEERLTHSTVTQHGR